VSIPAGAVRQQGDGGAIPARRIGGDDVRYLYLLNSFENGLPAPGSDEAEAMEKAWGVATDAMRAAGVLIDCAPLAPTTASTTVRVREGETLITDGPAAEIKEHLGGYAIVNCADLDEALRWAATVPSATDASVIVRPIVDVEART
jgi:hypothetical protein